MLRICFCNEICPSLKNIPHDIYTIYTFVSRFFTFLSSPVIIRFIKRRYTIGTVRGKESDDRNQPIGFGLKNIVPTSTVNITRSRQDGNSRPIHAPPKYNESFHIHLSIIQAKPLCDAGRFLLCVRAVDILKE